MRVNLTQFKTGREERKSLQMMTLVSWPSEMICYCVWEVLFSQVFKIELVYALQTLYFYPGATPICVGNKIIYIKIGE